MYIPGSGLNRSRTQDIVTLCGSRISLVPDCIAPFIVTKKVDAHRHGGKLPPENFALGKIRIAPLDRYRTGIVDGKETVSGSKRAGHVCIPIK